MRHNEIHTVNGQRARERAEELFYTYPMEERRKTILVERSADGELPRVSRMMDDQGVTRVIFVGYTTGELCDVFGQIAVIPH